MNQRSDEVTDRRPPMVLRICITAVTFHRPFPDKEPLWFGNVEAMPEVTVEVGERTLRAKPIVLCEGPERDRLYALAVDYWPDLLQYETKAALRKFPVIRLDPKE